MFGVGVLSVWFCDRLAVPAPFRVPRTYEDVTLPGESSLTDVMRWDAEEASKEGQSRGE